MITRIRSQENPSSPGSPKTPAKGVLNFKKGDVIRGEIVRDYGKGSVLVRSGGAAFRAFTKVSVREGEQYDFRVKVAARKNSPAILERAAKSASMPKTNKGVERIAAILSEVTSALSAKDLSPKTSAILMNLAHAVPANVYNGPAGDRVSWLLRFIADGGLFWESKVARSLLHGVRSDWKSKLRNDLKGMLLDLRKSLQSEREDRPEIDSAGKKVDEALDLIQEIQLENRDLLREEGYWVLFVPGRPEQGFNGAELYVRRNMKEKEIRFSMLLDFTHLGPIEITASILNSTITIRFEVADEQKAESVRMGLPVLEESLRDKGLVPGQLVCVVGAIESGQGEADPQKVRPADSINLVI